MRQAVLDSWRNADDEDRGERREHCLSELDRLGVISVGFMPPSPRDTVLNSIIFVYSDIKFP